MTKNVNEMRFKKGQLGPYDGSYNDEALKPSCVRSSTESIRGFGERRMR